MRKPAALSAEEMREQISLGDGPIKGCDLSSNAPIGDFEVEHEYFVLDVEKMAKEHRERVSPTVYVWWIHWWFVKLYRSANSGSFLRLRSNEWLGRRRGSVLRSSGKT